MVDGGIHPFSHDFNQTSDKGEAGDHQLVRWLRVNQPSLMALSIGTLKAIEEKVLP